MLHFSLYPESKKTTEIVFPQTTNAPSEIKAGMTPIQVADIISNRLIEIVEKSLEKNRLAQVNS